MKNAMALYRKTLIPMQIGICAICAVVAFRGMSIPGVLVIFLVMQLSAVIGAIWGSRLQRRIKTARDRLPLS